MAILLGLPLAYVLTLIWRSTPPGQRLSRSRRRALLLWTAAALGFAAAFATTIVGGPWIIFALSFFVAAQCLLFAHWSMPETVEAPETPPEPTTLSAADLDRFHRQLDDFLVSGHYDPEP